MPMIVDNIVDHHQDSGKSRGRVSCERGWSWHWRAIFAPAATPRPIVDPIAGDMQRVLAQPDPKVKLTAIGIDVRGSTPQELATFVQTEVAKWGKIIKDSGATLD